MVTLFFLTAAKIVPVVELHAIEHLRADHGHENRSHTPETDSGRAE